MQQDGNLYRRVVETIASTPWAILPETLAVITDLIAFRAAGGRLSEEEIQQRIGAGPSRRDPFRTVASGGGAVAVLPIYGVIAPKANLMTQYSGGTALSDFRTAFQQALGDPGVGAIVLDVDSPGGTTDLVPETAAEIRAARGTKPIVAIANTLCASAAYWLACQADELVGTPSGLLGSIGVFAAHDNLAGMLDQAGIERTLISAGQFKTDGNPWEKLSETARAAIQGLVDDNYEMFVADVAAGRGVSEQAVREGFGQGRVVSAAEAVRQGMADRVANFDETVGSLMQPASPGGRNALELQVDTKAIAASVVEQLRAEGAVPERKAEEEPHQPAGVFDQEVAALRQAAATTTEQETSEQ